MTHSSQTWPGAGLPPTLVRTALMRRLLCLVTLALLAWPPVPAHAREPLVNIGSAPIPGGLDATKIEKGIILGGMQRGWTMTKVADGHLQATLLIRRHTAVADVMWNGNAYSITYKDSVNLDYKDGRIHRNYNKWIRNLDQDIQRALLQLTLQ